jgi:hypothetical protein
MTNEKTLSLSAGIDYNCGLVGRYEFHLFDGDDVIASQGGFKSKASAISAGKRKAKSFLA